MAADRVACEDDVTPHSASFQTVYSRVESSLPKSIVRSLRIHTDENNNEKIWDEERPSYFWEFPTT